VKDEEKVSGELRALELHLDKFVDRGEARSGTCYLVKKGRNKKLNLHPAGSLCIDDYEQRGGNDYLVEVFNRFDRFISYDHATFLSAQAVLCGCTSIVIPEQVSYNSNDAQTWRNRFPYFKYGIAYGLDDIEYAKKTGSRLQNELALLESKTIQQARQFIKQARRLVALPGNLSFVLIG
jgi:hypothetical protein